jgi:hypothetical protein
MIVILEMTLNRTPNGEIFDFFFNANHFYR